jgi:5-methylcytosine-specific restriction protein B
MSTPASPIIAAIAAKLKSLPSANNWDIYAAGSLRAEYRSSTDAIQSKFNRSLGNNPKLQLWMERPLRGKGALKLEVASTSPSSDEKYLRDQLIETIRAQLEKRKLPSHVKTTSGSTLCRCNFDLPQVVNKEDDTPERAILYADQIDRTVPFIELLNDVLRDWTESVLPKLNLEALANGYNHAPKMNELHKLWAEFLERWPIERLREMTLEEYTNLKSKTDDYFCHWLERKTQKLGSIQGATSAKFGIYLAGKLKDTLKSGLTTDGKYVWREALGDTKESAFATIRDHIVKIVDIAQSGKQPLELDPILAPTIQMKLRFLYQSKPYQVLPMFSREFLTKVSERYLHETCTYENMVDINLRLRREHFPNEDVFEVMYRMVEENNAAPTERRYWAGSTTFEGSKQMAQEFISKNEWRSDFTVESARKTSDGKVFLNSFESVEIGDWLVIKGSGKANHIKVYYLGEVLEKDEDRFALQLKPLESPSPLPRSIDGVPQKGGKRGWKGTTLAEIINPEAIQLIFGVPTSPPKTTPMNDDLNRILYGPPGTGKTYSTVRQAVEIVDGSYDDNSVTHRFQELKRAGRIEFLTFHQSYSYEDFVEGIRPDVDEEGNAHFTCQDGIFKEIAAKAAFLCLEEVTLSEGPTFSQLWERLLEVIDEDDAFRLKSKTQEYVPKITSRGNIEAVKEDNLDHVVANCGRTPTQEVFTKVKALDEVNSGHVRRALGRGANWHLMASVINELKRLESSWEQEDEENTSTAAKDITPLEMKTAVLSYLKDGEASGYRLKSREEWPPFVLIIDEINRGNISKILGELITLLEPDKRLGAENELSVQLPYSKEVFAVPGNLHLVGTMNTADKSIALVDVALRRRFQFDELNPDFTICPDLPTDLLEVMQEINNRIMLRKDRDHRIGHAYFMKVDSKESFDEVMLRKIIPLLAEYFYNDWDGLRFVLNEKENDKGLIRPIKGITGSGRNRWQWYYDTGEDLSPAETLLSNFKQEQPADGE